MNSEINSSEIPRALCTVLTNRTILSPYSAVYMEPKKTISTLTAPQYIIQQSTLRMKADGSCPVKTYSCTYQTHISNTGSA